MIDHVSIAVRDLESATRFYQDALAPLGYTLREVRAKTVAFGKKYSEFWLNLLPDAMPLPDWSWVRSRRCWQRHRLKWNSAIRINSSRLADWK